MEPTAQDSANEAEAIETYARQMRQHFESDWTGATSDDLGEYWTMRNAKPVLRQESRDMDRA